MHTSLPNYTTTTGQWRTREMQNPNWREASSNDAKSKIIGMTWETPLFLEYLWYFMGPATKIDCTDVAMIISLHFHGQATSGDIEVHPCLTLPGNCLLRLRGGIILKPSVDVGGKSWPLFQVGHGDDQNRINFELLWRESLTA